MARMKLSESKSNSFSAKRRSLRLSNPNCRAVWRSRREWILSSQMKSQLFPSKCKTWRWECRRPLNPLKRPKMIYNPSSQHWTVPSQSYRKKWSPAKFRSRAKRSESKKKRRRYYYKRRRSQTCKSLTFSRFLVTHLICRTRSLFSTIKLLNLKRGLMRLRMHPLLTRLSWCSRSSSSSNRTRLTPTRFRSCKTQ